MLRGVARAALFCMEAAKKSTIRRDKLISLQERARLIWNRFQYFSAEPDERPKFFSTFPYPYMNGTLHLGHAFTMTKTDFNTWYKRLRGFNVLFPFGFHCTGMPICASAQKLKKEFESYGNPPRFPEDENPNEAPPQEKDEPPVRQYKILQQMNLGLNDYSKFVDPTHWVRFFPPLGRQHLQNFGLHVDHARSFVTTYLNPYYNSFVEWQFNRLKERGYIKFGVRPSIYSPKDGQMCADHDRAEGEGINPEEFTLIKLEVLELNQKMKACLAGKKVFLVAATLRPQTMYGQTSCYLLPTGEYQAVEMKNGEVFICSARSARNMAYQNLTAVNEAVNVLGVFTGESLLGLPLKAPLSVYPKIYTLPMMTISMNKGTGVVTCVPSDSPDDWMAYSDLRKKEALRKKYNLTEEMVALEPVPIIDIPSLGTMAAVKICETMKIASQNDRAKLDLAKDECYKKGFHEGIMIIGDFAGKKVADAKVQVKQQLIEQGNALSYYEPGGIVVSRSGEDCVVKMCDQWYLNYADEVWKEKVLNFVQDKSKFHVNNEVVFNDLIYTIKWLREWGCSRSFGLGTQLPFDKQYLIESLSDSTVYFAFYTVCHLLQADLYGSTPGVLGIRPQELTEDLWDYAFLGNPYKSGKVPQYKLDKLRAAFLYWYPMDLRCSGKDLLKNHLTMSLFNHVAIWDDDKFWPRGFNCNGFINIDSKKMSKSTGNFITLAEATLEYGADSTRLACAQAGDSINDANFTRETANAAIMQLSTLEMFLVRALEHKLTYRQPEDQATPEVEFADKIFQNEMQNQIERVTSAYERMIYRDVVREGFHDFVGLKDAYLLNCEPSKPRADLIEQYIHLQLLMLYPICPHFCEVSYIDYLLPFARDHQIYKPLLGQCRFPEARKDIDYGAIRSNSYIQKALINMRDAFNKVSKPKKNAEVVALKKMVIIFRKEFMPYQIAMLKLLKDNLVDGQIKADWRAKVQIESGQEKTKALKFAAFVEDEFKLRGEDALEQSLPFVQQRTLELFSAKIRKNFPLDLQIIEAADAPERPEKGWKETLSKITPGYPTFLFE